MVVKTLLSLGAVLTLMVGLAYVLKKTLYRSSTRQGDRVEIDLLGQRMFGPRRSICVVRVLDRVLVVGITEHGMQALSEIPVDEQPPAEASSEDTPVRPGWPFSAGPHPGSFAGQLQRALEAFSTRVTPRARNRRPAPKSGRST